MAEAREPFLGMTAEEEAFAKKLAGKALVSSLTHPLCTVKTLVQLGHEPFPLSTGKTLIVAGRNAYFLPNAFSYALQLAERHGWRVLFTGVDSAIASLVVQAVVHQHTTNYIDKYYPEIGGKADKLDAEEKDLSDEDSFRRALRSSIRDSLVSAVAITASRPLTVVMVRQIAQLIGNETKYTNVLSSLRLIGVEEGPAGFFSGLVPAVVGSVVVTFGVHIFAFAAERAILRSGLYEKATDEQGKKELDNVRKFVQIAVPFVVSSFGLPYQVVSTLMAVTGSGLAVSFLPYSPTFGDWMSAWDYLKPHGLKRGARLFLREQQGAVSVGSDQRLYASNKHFIA